MKNMLIAAATLGVTIAGLILYFERKNRPGNRILDASDDAYETMNRGIGSVERPIRRALG